MTLETDLIYNVQNVEDLSVPVAPLRSNKGGLLETSYTINGLARSLGAMIGNCVPLSKKVFSTLAS